MRPPRSSIQLHWPAGSCSQAGPSDAPGRQPQSVQPSTLSEERLNVNGYKQIKVYLYALAIMSHCTISYIFILRTSSTFHIHLPRLRIAIQQTNKDSKHGMMWCYYFSNVLNKTYCEKPSGARKITNLNGDITLICGKSYQFIPYMCHICRLWH